MPKPDMGDLKDTLHFNELYQESEAMLLRLGKWVIFGIQALGYFPLSINKRRQSLEWKLVSFPVLINMVLLIMSILWYIFFHVFSVQMAAGSGISGDTEMVAFMASCCITTSVGALFRLQACFRVKRVLGFWHQNCHFLASFSSLGQEFELSQYRKLFGWARNFRDGQMKQLGLALSLYTIYAVIAPQFLFKMQSEGSASLALYIIFYFLCGIWGLTVSLHVLSSFCIVFFLKLYMSCLKIVSENLDRLFGGQDLEPTSMEHAHLFPTRISFIMVKSASPGNERKKDLNLELKDGNTAKTLTSCILAYELVEKQVASHNAFFAIQTILQILVDIFGIVTFAFFFMLHVGSGRQAWIITDIIPILAMSMDLHHLSSDATYLTLASKGVLDQIHRVPLHELSSKLRYKVQMLAMRISTKPITVSPGNYFDLNRKIIASILSVITTYLVVMVQFRSADRIK